MISDLIQRLYNRDYLSTKKVVMEEEKPLEVDVTFFCILFFCCFFLRNSESDQDKMKLESIFSD